MAYLGQRSFNGRRTTKKPVVELKPERFTPPDGWNAEFKTFFDFVVNGTGNGCVEAVAGGGKTTAVVEAIMQALEKNSNQKVLFVAFNVSIKDEGAKRLRGWNCDVMTCHGLGFHSLRKSSSWGGPDGKQQFDVQDHRGAYMQSLVQAEIGPEKEKSDDRDALMDLISKAKTTLTSDVNGMINLMDRFDIETSYDRCDFAEKALKIMNFTAKRPGTSLIIGQGRSKGRKLSKAAITFDDEIWLPIVNDWHIDKYDMIFVDECQDLSPARRELIKRALKPSGRIIVIGDRYQSIYSFSGADIDSLPILVDEFDCKMLPLSCSWRCDENIIREAQQLNPNIVARPNADEGIVDKIEVKDLIDKIKEGDVLLSRTNAPLVRIFFQLARQQRKVKFIGRDYGRMLSYRIKSWRFRHETKVVKGEASGLFTGHVMLSYNDEWLRIQSQNQDGEEVKVTDRQKDEHSTIIALTLDLNSSLDSERSVKEVLDRCAMFSPNEKPDDKDGETYVTLSSTHRFKGLERNHAYLLIDTYKAGADQEESNLLYVAQTRARHHLTYVVGRLNSISSET